MQEQNEVKVKDMEQTPLNENEEVSEVEAEPTEAIPADEVLPEETGEAPTKGKLAEEVKQRLLSCAEDDKCLDAFSARFEEVARKLNVPVNDLIDSVFSVLLSES